MSEKEASITGAAALCAIAAASGVEVVFANPGTSEMHVVGALSERQDIRKVLVLHENVATGAADGYSRMKRDRKSLAATLLHLAPGLMNGLSNLHNAMRARSSILNIVGDMSTFHRGADALLENDIESLAKCVSRKFVRTSLSAESVASDSLDAVDSAKRDRGVATLIIPHDVSWEAVQASELERQLTRARELCARPSFNVSDDIRGFLRQMIERAKELSPGDFLFYIGGDACGADELRIVGEIAAALGADIVCECFFTSIARGGDLREIDVRRAPYFPKDAAAEFAKYKVVCFLDVQKPPVAMFGYKDTPTRLFAQSEDDMWIIDPPHGLLTIDILRALASELGLECGSSGPSIADIAKGVESAIVDILGKPVEDKTDSLWHYGMNSAKAVATHAKLCKDFDVKLQTTIVFDHNNIAALTAAVAKKLGVSPVTSSPTRPTFTKKVHDSPTSTLESPLSGELSGSKVCKIVAATQPKDCVVVDESLTSGATYWKDSASCENAFTHVTLTGGSIGFSLAASVGVSIAAPGKQVITLVGDGSAAYTAQALWTQARERLNIVTVIMNNGTYQILRVECAIQGIQSTSGDACKSLTNLSDPPIDWVKLAEGYGVRSFRARTVDDFTETLKRALESDGPTLIDAVLSE